MNGINTNWHPYNPRDPEAVPTAAQARYFDPSRAIIRQAPFAGIDIGFGEYVKVTAEARYRIITDHPDSLGSCLLHIPWRGLDSLWARTGWGGDPEFKIGVGYNISTLE